MKYKGITSELFDEYYDSPYRYIKEERCNLSAARDFSKDIKQKIILCIVK